MRNRESDLVKGCLDYLRLRGVFAWRSNNVPVFDPKRKCFRSFRGLRGVSDILGILPGGIFLAVECKRYGEKLRPEQETFLDNVRQRGGVAMCAYTVLDLEAVLGDLLDHLEESP